MKKLLEQSLILFTWINSSILGGILLGLIPVTDPQSDPLTKLLGLSLLGFPLVILWLEFVQPYFRKIIEAQKDLEDYRRRNP